MLPKFKNGISKGKAIILYGNMILFLLLPIWDCKIPYYIFRSFRSLNANVYYMNRLILLHNYRKPFVGRKKRIIGSYVLMYPTIVEIAYNYGTFFMAFTISLSYFSAIFSW